jgi:ornithine cyclodeaminase/alanine dehydrogenase-like protein (mu-crystallin family)
MFTAGTIRFMLFLNESDVRRLLPMNTCVDLMAAVFGDLASGKALNQPRRRLVLPTGSALHSMAGADGKYFGTKIYATNPKHSAHFLFVLFNAEDARPLALMEANALGQIRTGAASGYATRVLAAPGADTCGFIGTGYQAHTQVEAMLAARPLKEVKVWSRTPERRREFAAACSRDFSINVRPVNTAREAVEGAPIVVTATNSKEPVLEAAWIAPGAHINAMGSNQAQRRELPSDLVERADLIAVDSLEQAKIESGDLLLAIDPARWTPPKFVELKDVTARPSPQSITIFKSNGLAVEDVIAAGYIYEQAISQGAGIQIPLFAT